MIALYTLTLIALSIFSFGFVDANFPVQPLPGVFDFVHKNRPLATALYVFFLGLLFCFYFWALRHGRSIWKIIFLTIGILVFSFPAFSYDIFNYVATAKVTYYYQENPYIVMPIEIPDEPMLRYLHAANKTALYGPFWILLTFFPHAFGAGNVMVSVYAFKALMVVFYLMLSYLVWNISGRKATALAFFALNPLVIIETLVSAHNDVVMMTFALAAFMFAKKKRFLFAWIFLLFSILIKFSTLVLLPLLFFVHVRRLTKIDWEMVWKWSAYLLFGVFLLSPLREELYAWYFIWPFTFLALLPKRGALEWISHGLSMGLLLRFAPFIYAGEWGRWVPFAKKIVTAVPPAVSTLVYYVKKRR